MRAGLSLAGVLRGEAPGMKPGRAIAGARPRRYLKSLARPSDSCPFSACEAILKKRPVGQNFAQAAAKGTGRVAVRQYGPAHLRRGGPLGRASAELARGRRPATAAAIAAKQGKG